MKEPAIVADGLSKMFLLHLERRTRLKELFIRGKAPAAQQFWALRDASFTVPKGTTFGLVGQNGAGKSTALKVLAGIYRPTRGFVGVNGRVSALLELGSGFHGELTGRENIRLNGAILGLSGRQVAAAMDSIIEFAAIGEFIDQPVKVYSSGMFVRLGFAVAISLDPEILIVDEVIAVGDEEFQRKCLDYLFDLRRRGRTIVFVSHSLGLVGTLCDQAAWLEQGIVRQLGPARDVVEAYIESINVREIQAQTGETAFPQETQPTRIGSGEVRVASLEILDDARSPSAVVVSGRPCTLRIRYRALSAVDGLTFSLSFVHESGVHVAGPDSSRMGPFSVEPGLGYVDFDVPDLLLQAGTYRVSASIMDHGHVYDVAKDELELRVRGRGDHEAGLTRLPGRWLAPVRTEVRDHATVEVGSGAD